MNEPHRPYLPPPWPDDGLPGADQAQRVLGGQAVDMDALANRIQELKIEISARVEGQRADHARIAALETAARAVVDDIGGAAPHHCPTCGAYLIYQEHGRGCAIMALAALMGEDQA